MVEASSVWIVVVHWKGLDDTLACLESLANVQYKERRIIVVHNGAADGSIAALRSAQSRLQFEIIEAGRNLGYAGGGNLGIRHALDSGADFVLVLNNDTTVDPMLLDELLSAASAHPEAGCFGPWVYYMHDPARLWWAGTAWSKSALSFTWPGRGRLTHELPACKATADAIVGTALFFRASVPHRIGLLDERFFLCNEEYDWCCRARRAGFECVTVPTARVWHKVSASFGGPTSPLINYFDTRNKLLFVEKNASRMELIRLLCRGIRRFWPPLRLERGAGVPLWKALFWAVRSHVRDWARRAHDPQEIAHRCAVRDYVSRRFGDCPSRIRTINEVWARSRAASGLVTPSPSLMGPRRSPMP